MYFMSEYPQLNFELSRVLNYWLTPLSITAPNYHSGSLNIFKMFLFCFLFFVVNRDKKPDTVSYVCVFVCRKCESVKLK